MSIAPVRPGDFAIIPISGPVGTLISAGEWLDGDGFANYDHAEIFLGVINGTAVTMGAYPGGARLVALPPPPQQQGWLWSSGHIALTDNQRTAIVANALGCKGVPYSSLDYFAIAAHRLHIPAPWLKTYISSTHHLICSQLVDLCYDNAGVHLFTDKRWPGYVTPADLAHLILADTFGLARQVA